MSLYEGLGLDTPNDADKAQKEKDKADKATSWAPGAAARMPAGWNVSKQMIAAQLKRKAAAEKAQKLKSPGLRTAAVAARSKPASSTASPRVMTQELRRKIGPTAMLANSGTTGPSSAGGAAGSASSQQNEPVAMATEPFEDSPLCEKEISVLYDPFKPNDFEVVKQRNLQGDTVEARERRQHEEKRKAAIAPPPQQFSRELRRSPSQSPPPVKQQPPEPAPTTRTKTPPPPSAKVDLAISGEEAFMRRMRLSQPQAAPGAGHPAVSTPSERQRPPPAKQPKLGEAAGDQAGIGAKLMQKFGWNPGQGLGKDEQGRSSALTVEKTGRLQGKIVDKSASTPQSLPARSRVMMLKNLVGPGQVDDDLRDETMQECGKFGEVLECVVYECPRGTVPEHEAVRIFILFSDPDAATKGVESMNGRFFGGRRVTAEYFDEKRFGQKAFGP